MRTTFNSVDDCPAIGGLRRPLKTVCSNHSS
jgi:hypothetical protein